VTTAPGPPCFNGSPTTNTETPPPTEADRKQRSSWIVRSAVVLARSLHPNVPPKRAVERRRCPSAPVPHRHFECHPLASAVGDTSHSGDRPCLRSTARVVAAAMPSWLHLQGEAGGVPVAEKFLTYPNRATKLSFSFTKARDSRAVHQGLLTTTNSLGIGEMPIWFGLRGFRFLFLASPSYSTCLPSSFGAQSPRILHCIRCA